MDSRKRDNTASNNTNHNNKQQIPILGNSAGDFVVHFPAAAAKTLPATVASLDVPDPYCQCLPETATQAGGIIHRVVWRKKVLACIAIMLSLTLLTSLFLVGMLTSPSQGSNAAALVAVPDRPNHQPSESQPHSDGIAEPSTPLTRVTTSSAVIISHAHDTDVRGHDAAEDNKQEERAPVMDKIGEGETAAPPAEAHAPPFVATNEWQEILPGQAIPPGLHVSVDLATGKKMAKLLENRPGILTLSEKREAKLKLISDMLVEARRAIDERESKTGGGVPSHPSGDDNGGESGDALVRSMVDDLAEKWQKRKPHELRLSEQYALRILQLLRNVQERGPKQQQQHQQQHQQQQQSDDQQLVAKDSQEERNVSSHRPSLLHELIAGKAIRDELMHALDDLEDLAHDLDVAQQLEETGFLRIVTNIISEGLHLPYPLRSGSDHHGTQLLSKLVILVGVCVQNNEKIARKVAEDDFVAQLVLLLHRQILYDHRVFSLLTSGTQTMAGDQKQADRVASSEEEDKAMSMLQLQGDAAFVKRILFTLSALLRSGDSLVLEWQERDIPALVVALLASGIEHVRSDTSVLPENVHFAAGTRQSPSMVKVLARQGLAFVGDMVRATVHRACSDNHVEVSGNFGRAASSGEDDIYGEVDSVSARPVHDSNSVGSEGAASAMEGEPALHMKGTRRELTKAEMVAHLRSARGRCESRKHDTVLETVRQRLPDLMLLWQRYTRHFGQSVDADTSALELLALMAEGLGDNDHVPEHWEADVLSAVQHSCNQWHKHYEAESLKPEPSLRQQAAGEDNEYNEDAYRDKDMLELYLYPYNLCRLFLYNEPLIQMEKAGKEHLLA